MEAKNVGTGELKKPSESTHPLSQIFTMRGRRSEEVERPSDRK